MDTIEWIQKNLSPKVCNSEEFFYNEMESQSGFSLPILYEPFDASKRGHWSDRGWAFDFLYSTRGEGKRLLDFGPGDGWPSLIVAPYAAEVIGVDGSRRRTQVCAANAARLGIRNAHFLFVEPGAPLPFPDESFDGVMAASSIEQTQDPLATLTELHRVLKPGGSLRVSYESLNAYRGGQERVADLNPAGEGGCWLTLYDRHIAMEQARMASLKFSLPIGEVVQALTGRPGSPEDTHLTWEQITPQSLESVKGSVSEARLLTLAHPSGATFLRWMTEIGFAEALPTHSGGVFAWHLFEQTSPEKRPTTMEELDALLMPLVKIVVTLEAPPRSARGFDPCITAVKAT